MGDWGKYADSEFGLLESARFDDSLFGYQIAPNDYVIVQGEGYGPLVEDGSNYISWHPGDDIARTPLFYFARYDGNGNKIGYVGFDLTVVCDYTILGHRANVSATTTACVRDLNKDIVQDLGSRTVGTAADSDSYYGFEISFYLSIGKATDKTTIAIGGVTEVYNPDKEARDQRGWVYAGIISSNTNWQNIEYDEEEESPEFGKPAKRKGGYVWRKTGKKPTFNNHSDTIVPTSLPTEGVTRCGFVNVYKVNRSALEQLGTIIFPQPSDFLEAIANRNLADYVVSLKLLPCAVPSSGGGNIIRLGYKSKRIESPGDVRQVDSDYIEVDLGSAGLAEYWANFLDYTGTKAKLFLPFYGFVDIEPEFWNGGGRLHIIYRINVMDGSFVAMIRSTSGMSELTDSLIAQYTGNCCVNIPVTGVQYGNMFLREVTMAAGLGVNLAAGNTGGVSSVFGNINSLKPNVSKSNGYNGSSGFYGHRRPYLLIERQVSQFSEKYPSEVGLPYYVQDLIGNCRGLTIATKMHLDGVTATMEEKDMIKQLFQEGVIVDAAG